jgi:hypothetical protein
MIDYTALKNEITTDPLGLGYALFVSAGNDQAVVDLLNTTTGPSAAQVSLPYLSRTTFLGAILPATLVLPTLSADLQSKWGRILAVVRASDGVDLTDSGVQGLIALAAGDGVLTSDQAAAIGKRTGSRAEVLFGAGTTIKNNDVSYALRGMK